MSQLGDYILSFCSESAGDRTYADAHLGRFIHTLEITPCGAAGDRILEMGAYMQITPALKTILGYGEVRGSYLGPAGTTDDKRVVSNTGETFQCYIDLFDAESDPFPYPDGHFKTVVCCELLEHLAEDPMHMIAEVNRVLQVDGHLVLSTPNIISFRSIAGVLGGYHPGLYSQFTTLRGGNKANPRHAREYTPGEIHHLLESSGFVVERVETGPYGMDRPAQHDWVIPIMQEKGLGTDLREEVIHAVGRKTGPVKDRYPSWLYEQ